MCGRHLGNFFLCFHEVQNVNSSWISHNQFNSLIFSDIKYDLDSVDISVNGTYIHKLADIMFDGS